MMKTHLFISAVFCLALSVRAATVFPSENVEAEKNKTSVAEAGAEAAVETNAVLPQARFDFCLDGWLSFRGNCYLLVNFLDTWYNAESYCEGFEGSLASVHNIRDYQFLQRLARTGGHPFAWIGGFLFLEKWRWEDGTAYDYDNLVNVADLNAYQCLQLSTEDGWSNHGCNMRMPFICQIRSNC